MTQVEWWWMNKDSYTVEDPLPQAIIDYAGPKGVALVKAYDSGSTTPGWGGDEFIGNYSRRRFNATPILAGYNKGMNNFAIVMRSVQLICVDIDGKNGGIEHAAEILGNVPLTLAETSKSGNGFHLFFTYEDEWDEQQGFAGFTDSIGVVQGVDIRSVGCVYHYPQQRWNDAPIAELPQWIVQKLQSRKLNRAAQQSRITKIVEAGDWEIAMLQDELKTELAKPVKQGERNNTLFAIGSQMKAAEVPDWEDLVYERAVEVGLDDAEANKLVENITRYGDKQP